MQRSRSRVALVGLVLAATVACGGGSATTSPPPASGTSASPGSSSPASTEVPEYGNHFDPVPQNVAQPKRLLAAFHDNYVRSLAAWTAQNASLSRRYLLFIVGAGGASTASYQLLYNRVPVDSSERVDSAGGFQSYLRDLASTYTIKQQSSTSRRVTVDVVEHQPAFPGEDASSAINTSLTLVFVHQAKGQDRYGARFVLTEIQPH